MCLWIRTDPPFLDSLGVREGLHHLNVFFSVSSSWARYSQDTEEQIQEALSQTEDQEPYRSSVDHKCQEDKEPPSPSPQSEENERKNKSTVR